MPKHIANSIWSYLWAGLAGGGAGLMLVFGGALWFPVMTLGFFGTLGMVLSLNAPKFSKAIPESVEEPVTEDSKSAVKLASAVAGALFGFMFLYWVLDPIRFSTGAITYTAWFSVFQLPAASIAEQQASFFFLVFTVPWAEENWFRAFFGNLFVLFLPEGWAEIAAGFVFAGAHAAVYSLIIGPYTNWNWPLIGLLSGAGAIFVFVDLETGDLITSEISHGLYNAMSFAVAGSVLGKILPGVTVPFPMQAGLIAGVPAAFLFVRLYKRPIAARRWRL